MCEHNKTNGEAAEGGCSRRGFLQRSGALLGLGLCGGTLMSLLQACENELTKYPDVIAGGGKGIEIDVMAEPDLQSVGGAIQRSLGSFNGGKPVTIIRAEQERFLVLSAVCTHQGCTVAPPGTPGGSMVCPCHGAEFSPADGAVLKGPAEQNLKVFPSSYDAAAGILTLNSAGGGGPEIPLAEATLLLSDYPQLQAVGGALKVAIPPYNDGRKVIIIRRAADQFLAVTSVCSHNQCEINLPAAPAANMVCPCHGAEYSSSDGSWQDSPQTASDLQVFATSYSAENDSLTISFPVSA